MDKILFLVSIAIMFSGVLFFIYVVYPVHEECWAILLFVPMLFILVIGFMFFIFAIMLPGNSKSKPPKIINIRPGNIIF